MQPTAALNVFEFTTVSPYIIVKIDETYNFPRQLHGFAVYDLRDNRPRVAGLPTLTEAALDWLYLTLSGKPR